MSLVIRDLQGNDQQQYVCESNVVSMDTSTVSLTVLGQTLSVTLFLVNFDLNYSILVAPSVNISGQLNVVQGNPPVNSGQSLLTQRSKLVYGMRQQGMIQSHYLTGIAGMTTTLSCTVTGVPAPIQTWTRNGIAPSDSRFQILNNGSDLIISEIREEDQGEYRCHVSNSAGSDTTVVRFNVIS